MAVSGVVRQVVSIILASLLGRNTGRGMRVSGPRSKTGSSSIDAVDVTADANPVKTSAASQTSNGAAVHDAAVNGATTSGLTTSGLTTADLTADGASMATLESSDPGHLLEQIADRLSDMVLAVGLDGSLYYVSPSVENVIGYSDQVFMRLYNHAMVYSDDQRFLVVQEFVARQLQQLRQDFAEG